MISSVDPRSQRFLEILQGLNSRMEKLQAQMASGKRLNSPSDEPVSVIPLLEVRARLASLEQTQSNLSRLKTEVDTGESAMQSAVKLMDRIRTLGMSGASGVQTAATRSSIADEIGSLLTDLAGLANSQVDGRYIFSGDGDQTAAYLLDLTQTPPWGTYQGSQATKKLLDTNSVAFPVSKTAQEIFDNPDPTINAFQAVENLRQALLANDDSALKAALQPLAAVSEHLNSVLSFYGNTQRRIDEATNSGEQLKVRLTQEQSGLEDLDATQAIVELQSLKFSQQAALDVKSKMPRVSLFDYLG
jgi:flagellar hook-associated protein 3 FlgL